MKKRHTHPAQAGSVNLARRRFVQGLTAGGVLAGLGSVPGAAFALSPAAPRRELSGTEFDLVVDELPVNFTGRTRRAVALNGQVPAPLLRWREGDHVTLRVTNRLKTPTSIHWHGLILPNNMDGVPGLTFDGIAPGTTFTYHFPVQQSGTYWYHSHSGFQEQSGHYGPIVIAPRTPDPNPSERDYVVVLSDWSDESPERVFGNLKKMDGYYNYAQPTAVDFVRQVRQEGFLKALGFRAMWDEMRMSPRDLADVSAATYTYLMNGVTPAGNWSALFRRGERVRLRFINAAAMTYFDVRIPGLSMTVVSADGQDVHPVDVDEFRIGVAETYDVIVTPKDDTAYTIFAQSADRSGYARGSLAPRAGLSAAIPALDPVPTLSMADMGMAHDMGHAHDTGMSDGTGQEKKTEMTDHSGHDMAGAPDTKTDHSGHDMGAMSGMQTDGAPASTGAGGGMLAVTRHPATEQGPGTAMPASVVSTRLDDPGVGLRDNGRRVLTYADLRGPQGWIDPRAPGRTIELHLTGNMERYMWSFDGVKFSDAEPLRLQHGELVRIVLINDTMMEHPIHLHGLWSELESPDGKFQVRKHTISVKPGHAVSYRVLADAKGRWAYHCHLLFHMEAGMFREVNVA
jgi:CopA family copper-resistance protein